MWAQLVSTHSSFRIRSFELSWTHETQPGGQYSASPHLCLFITVILHINIMAQYYDQIGAVLAPTTPIMQTDVAIFFLPSLSFLVPTFAPSDLKPPFL